MSNITNIMTHTSALKGSGEAKHRRSGLTQRTNRSRLTRVFIHSRDSYLWGNKPKVCASLQKARAWLREEGVRGCLSVSTPLMGVSRLVFLQTHEKDGLLPVLSETVQIVSAMTGPISGSFGKQWN